MAITARHLAKRAPVSDIPPAAHAARLDPGDFLAGKFAIALAPLSTLMPGMIPCCSSAATKRATVASLLPNRFIKENHAADKFAHARRGK